MLIEDQLGVAESWQKRSKTTRSPAISYAGLRGWRTARGRRCCHLGERCDAAAATGSMAKADRKFEAQIGTLSDSYMEQRSAKHGAKRKQCRAEE